MARHFLLNKSARNVKNIVFLLDYKMHVNDLRLESARMYIVLNRFNFQMGLLLNISPLNWQLYNFLYHNTFESQSSDWSEGVG